jgi:site-specific recombinase XerD
MDSVARHLARQGKVESTIETYEKIIDRCVRSGDDPVEWAWAQTRSAPIGTVLPIRAAVKHYLVAGGMAPHTAHAALPPAKGRPDRIREALTPEQQRTYAAAVAQEADGPVKALLGILPRTGLRISEACNLRWEDVQHRGSIPVLVVTGKRGKQRLVPLSAGAVRILDQHRAWMARWKTHRSDVGETFLFPGYGEDAITPDAVRKAVRDLRAAHPGLDGLTPHVLRHTFATNLIRAGRDIDQVRVLLGHTNVKTTIRYLHPATDILADAVAAIDGDDE